MSVLPFIGDILVSRGIDLYWHHLCCMLPLLMSNKRTSGNMASVCPTGHLHTYVGIIIVE